MKKMIYRLLLLAGVMTFGILSLTGCGELEIDSTDSTAITIIDPAEDDSVSTEFVESTESYEITSDDVDYLPEDGSYTTKEDVCEYLIEYGTLPGNFITKKEAKKLGWSGGGLDDYAPGCSIGGDVFGNYEGVLPQVKGRTYHECDIDTMNAKKRGAKRIVYSDDGNIYYTEDHYETFTLLYGDDEE